MGFDVTLMRANKQSVEEILDKYYSKCLDDLPYEAFGRDTNKKRKQIL